MTMKKLSVVLAALFVLSASAPPASASAFKDKFFEVVKDVHPDPDQVEMARYYVDSPEHAEPVYAKAAAQDYVFIAILAAAKGARGQTIPGSGLTFNYDTCLTPVHAFDAVFARTGDFMNKYGQEAHVKAYAQAQNQQAKDAAAAELARYIPYAQDIPHICHFTFYTNLQREQDLRDAIVGRSRTLKESYQAFSGGDVVTGTSKLISAGVSEKSACVFVDEVIYGGYISKTPLVGDLALGACKGFVGNVIGAVGDAAGAGLDAINDLGDVIGGQSKHIPQEAYYDRYWAPRLDELVAHIRDGTGGDFLRVLWEPCADYFDSHTMSRKNAQKTCNRFRDAFAAAGEQRVAEEDLIAANKAEIDRNLPVWGKAFSQKWNGECEDNPCTQEIQRLRNKGLERGRSLELTNALQGWPYVENALQPFHGFAAEEVERAKQREIAVNRDITDGAAEGWAKLLIGAWTPRCVDQICRKEVARLGGELVVTEKQLQRDRPDESSLAIQKTISGQFGPRFQKAVDDSKARSKVAADPNAAPDDRLVAMGCKSFLGRKGRWLCYEPSAYDACVRYVDGHQAVECIHPPSKRRHPAEGTPALARNDRETPTRTTPPGPIRIGDGGRSRPPIIRRSVDPMADLGGKGCKLFLGRPGSFLCTTDEGYDACRALKDDGRVKECRRTR